MPWTTFEKERLKSVLQERDFGWTIKECLDEAYGAGPENQALAMALLQVQKCFNDGLATWQQQNVSFQEFLACSGEDIRNKKNVLLTFMARSISKDVASMNNRIRMHIQRSCFKE